MGSDTILLAAANSVLRAMAEHPGGKVGELERRLWSLEATSELSWWTLDDGGVASLVMPKLDAGVDLPIERSPGWHLVAGAMLFEPGVAATLMSETVETPIPFAGLRLDQSAARVCGLLEATHGYGVGLRRLPSGHLQAFDPDGMADEFAPPEATVMPVGSGWLLTLLEHYDVHARAQGDREARRVFDSDDDD